MWSCFHRPALDERDTIVDEALVFLDGVEQSLELHRVPFLGQIVCVATPLYSIVGPRCASIAGGRRHQAAKAMPSRRSPKFWSKRQLSDP